MFAGHPIISVVPPNQNEALIEEGHLNQEILVSGNSTELTDKVNTIDILNFIENDASNQQNKIEETE